LKPLKFLITTAGLGILLLTACASSANLPPIRVGVDATLPPFESEGNQANEFKGFDIDLMKSLANNAGYNVDFVNVPTSTLLTGVLNCAYAAGISAITITEPLKSQMAFSDPYLTVGMVVVVQKGNLGVARIDQLSGSVVGIENGSIGPALSGSQFVRFPTLDSAFQALSAGEIDAVAASAPRAAYYANIPANHLKVLEGSFGSQALGIAVCKNNQDLLEKINAGLVKMKADGSLEQLARKWKIK
jgi:glutamine transport system substrate-binding protein